MKITFTIQIIGHYSFSELSFQISVIIFNISEKKLKQIANKISNKSGRFGKSTQIIFNLYMKELPDYSDIRYTIIYIS